MIALFISYLFESRSILCDKIYVISHQKAVEQEHHCRAEKSNTVQNDEVLLRDETYVFLLGRKNNQQHCEDDLQQLAEEKKNQHAEEHCVVKQPDVVVNPVTVMVELEGATVAAPTVFRVLKHLGVARFALIFEVLFVKLYVFFGFTLFKGLKCFLVESLEGHGWICRIRCRQYDCMRDHRKKSNDI